MHDDDEDAIYIESLEDPALTALADLVMSLRAARMAAVRYQICDAPLCNDAPPGVLEEVQKAEVHLSNAVAALGVSISLENEAHDV